MRIENPPTANGGSQPLSVGSSGMLCSASQRVNAIRRYQIPTIPLPRIPRSESLKINPKSVAPILNTKSSRQQATIHHESTTNSPSKSHVFTTHFRQKPLQNDEISLPQKNHPSKFQSAV
jgi:hypothetical protein